MKEKIIKAIDRGLMNVLSTDIHVHDIDFNRNDINNEYNHEVTLEELTDMFNENKESIFSKRYDTRNSLSIILDHNVKEISLYEYRKRMKPMFLKISTPELKKADGEILIYIPGNHLIHDKIQWQEHRKQVRNDDDVIKDLHIADGDLSGYKNCSIIRETVKNDNRMGMTPVIDYCAGLEIEGHAGYLPSMGQLRIIADNLDMINYVLSYIRAKKALKLNIGEWWSSTEYSHNFAWYLDNGSTYTMNTFKNASMSALPVFRYASTLNIR